MADRFEALPIFQQAHELVLQIYKATRYFPEEEKYTLVSQLRRSAASVPANIVEGNSRVHKKEFIQFLSIARSSLEETKYHLMLAKDFNYLNQNEYQELHMQSENVGRQLNGLIKFCNKKGN